MNTSGSEPQRAHGETGKRAPKANKSCLPCRVRKVKCDATVIGLPCSSCTSRQCAKDCVLHVRKGRSRKAIHVLPAPSSTRLSPATSHSSQLDRLNQSNQRQSSTSDHSDCQNPPQTEPDLLYLNILNDAVKETTESSQHHTTSNTPYRSRPEESFTPRNCLWTKLPQLDDIDNEYLAKKGVFDLPPPQHLDTLVKTYFDHVCTFAPVINRADFIRGYQSGDCSLFLLHVILTPASLHAPVDVLSACGFASRSAAQESFFSKAKLLHDFAAEDDPLLMLQGSIILCMVILDHPTDRDFSYWFHNAIRLATKLDLRDTCIREDKPRKIIKLYRRIWWTLYFLDIFNVFVNTRRSRLLENTSAIKPRTEDDWEAEDVSGVSSGLLSVVTPQQKALPVALCELSRIFGQCLSIVINKPHQDPRQMMHPLDTWRKSLANKMHVGGSIGTDVYYLNIQAMSYRFECILCRLIRRRLQQSQHADWSEWAKERLRSAILELDMISMRVLANGTLQDFPMPFITTITALLALHIESALDPAETDLVRSMARISISQTMLVLTQGKEIPALKRALPVFEEILAKKNLYPVQPSVLGQAPTQSQSQDNIMADAYTSPNTQFNIVPSQLEQGENNLPLYGDFLGLDFLDDWRLGSWNSLFDVDMGSQEQTE
ncbi:fungal-specific transcription factor domain-containing protein [Trichoderma asperelloides]|nr:fungal-specific transcription factor domain-containing protein [Trichoderma asperelloides]